MLETNSVCPLFSCWF